jgi:hypothetical protein
MSKPPVVEAAVHIGQETAQKRSYWEALRADLGAV